jgi:photosystem II stability/assembly factor-like uncharacterized protein
MKRTIILSTIALAIMATPALADMAGDTFYYHNGSTLYNTTVGSWAANPIGGFGIGDMTDIAFDTDGKLYGVSFHNRGSFYSINKNTGAATQLTRTFNAGSEDIGYGVNAL